MGKTFFEKKVFPTPLSKKLYTGKGMTKRVQIDRFQICTLFVIFIRLKIFEEGFREGLFIKSPSLNPSSKIFKRIKMTKRVQI
ncbi:MAG: hypothetical protein J6C42_08005, partial [Clostridia bacterium]|nr:hypothetical protein [Clostridia bacterium]